MSTDPVTIEVWQHTAARPDCGLKAIWAAAITIEGHGSVEIWADTRGQAFENAKRKAREILMRGTTRERHVIPVEELLS